MNKKLEKFTEYKIFHSDLEELDELSRSAVVVSNFAITEVNVLGRSSIMLSHNYTHDTFQDYLNTTNRMVIMRLWSAKLFEFFEFFSEVYKKLKADDIVYGVFEEMAIKKKALETSDGYYVARDLRNEATNHYSLSAAKKNYPHLSKQETLSMFVHKHEGNGYFALGDAVMFTGRIARRSGNSQAIELGKEVFKEWMDWNLLAQKWLSELNLQLCKSVFFDRLPDRQGQEMIHWFEPSWVGDVDESRTPLVLRFSRQVQVN